MRQDHAAGDVVRPGLRFFFSLTITVQFSTASTLPSVEVSARRATGRMEGGCAF